MIHIHIDDKQLGAKALIEYLKTLDYVRFEDEVNTWQHKKLDELQVAEDSGEMGYVNWDEAKKELSKKYRL